MSDEIKKDVTSELEVEILPPEAAGEAEPGELVIARAVPEEVRDSAVEEEKASPSEETKVLPAEEVKESAAAEKSEETPAAEKSEQPAEETPAAENAEAQQTETPVEDAAADAAADATKILPVEDVAPAEEVSAGQSADAALAQEVSKVMQGGQTDANPGAVPYEQAPDAEESEEDEPRKKLPRAVKILIGVLIGVAALAAVYVWFCFFGVKKDIYRQTSINNVDITGMTVEEAKEAVQKQFEEEYKDAAYEVVVDDQTYSIPVYETLSFDASKEIEDAYALCHGEWYTRGYEYLKNNFYPEEAVDISILPEVQDTDSIREAVQKIADGIASTAVNSSWSYDGNQVTIQTGEHGESIDPEKVFNEIDAQLKNNQFSGTVQTELILAEPKAVNAEEIAAAVNVEPVNAAYVLQDGEVVITPSSQGSKVTVEEINEQLAAAAEGSTVTIEKTIVEPTVREETLQEELFRDRLTVYEVPDGGSPSQLNNQGLACAAVNGAIVMPGETFSFNDLVGETTKEKGYVEDYAYNQGHLVTEVGGGICRVASTLYAAVLNSNLEIVMRYNHSSPVHYLPLGMDATVSYPLPDMRFKNNQGHPIKVIMWLDGGVVHAEILGTLTDEDPIVEVELNPITDMQVETYRMYYDRATRELLQKEYISTSVYKELIRDEDYSSSSSDDSGSDDDYEEYTEDTGEYSEETGGE